MSIIMQSNQSNANTSYFHTNKYPKIDYSNKSLWRSEKKTKERIEWLEFYLSNPAIETNFGKDHGMIRKWRGEKIKDKRIKQNIKLDPFRGNVYQYVYKYVEDLFKGYKGPNKNLFKDMKENLFEDFPDHYEFIDKTSSDPIKDKLKIVTRTKERIYDILDFLSKQNTV